MRNLITGYKLGNQQMRVNTMENSLKSLKNKAHNSQP